jgi:hypothetical protein
VVFFPNQFEETPYTCDLELQSLLASCTIRRLGGADQRYQTVNDFANGVDGCGAPAQILLRISVLIQTPSVSQNIGHPIANSFLTGTLRYNSP